MTRLDDSQTTEVTVKVRAFSGRWRAGLVIPALAGLLSASCASDATRSGESGSLLIIEALEGASGGSTNQDFSTVLQSDVRTKGSVFEDPGRVRLRLALKDIGTPGNPTSPTTNNFVTITRYRVSFRRSDGRNTPGQDVPYTFDGAMTFTVGSAPSSGVFSLVRAQAKLEPPLAPLGGLGGAIVISTIADVTFYGRDQAGNDVSVTGTMSINFADWADPQ
jgi:hypothetical protein